MSIKKRGLAKGRGLDALLGSIQKKITTRSSSA